MITKKRIVSMYQVCVEKCPSSSASPWAEARLPLPLPGLKATEKIFHMEPLFIFSGKDARVLQPRLD